MPSSSTTARPKKQPVAVEKAAEARPDSKPDFKTIREDIKKRYPKTLARLAE